MTGRLSLATVCLVLLNVGVPATHAVLAQRQTADEQALDNKRRAQNGIVVGQPKVYPDGMLQQMLIDAEARLAALQVVDQAALVSRLGTSAGASQRISALAVNAQGAPLPQVVTTNNGATGNTTAVKTSAVNTEGLPSSTDVATTNSAQPAKDVTITAPQVIPPPAPVTAPAGAFPTTFSVSPSDVLNEQMQLTFEIANLRLLLDGALSDRLFRDPKMRKIKPRTTIGVPITIDADRRYRNAVAIVEVEIERLNPLPETDEDPAITAVLPRDKTYNVAEITDSTRSIGGGVVTQLLGVSGSWLTGHKTYYLTQDQDTLGLTFAPARAHSVGVGWQFRPVLGREYVRPGLKQAFVQIAFPSAVTETFYGVVHARTYWRKFDRKRGIVGEVVGGSLKEEVLTWKIPRFPLEIGPADFQRTDVADLGGGLVLVNVPGAFLPGTYVRVGPTLFKPGSPNTTFELQRIRFVAPINDLAAYGAVLVARNGEEVPLVLHNPDPKTGEDIPLPSIGTATATGLDEARSVLTVKFTSNLDKNTPSPILVVGGRAFGGSDAPIQRTDDTLRAVVPTALVVSNPQIVATALFAPQTFAQRATVDGIDVLTPGDRLVLLEQKKDSARFLLYGTGLGPAKVIVPTGVTLEPIKDAGASDTLRVVSLTADQMKLQKRLVLQRGTGSPSFVAIPTVDFGSKAPAPPTARGRINVGGDEAVFVGDDLKSLVRVTYNDHALGYKVAQDGRSVTVRGLKGAGVTGEPAVKSLQFFFNTPVGATVDVVSSKIETVVR